MSASPNTLEEISKGAYTKPTSSYGQILSIDFRVNEDNSLDVLWIEKVGERHLSCISLTEKSLILHMTIPLKANSGDRFFGFEKLGLDKFIIGYAKSNAFGDKSAEAWYTAFDKLGARIIFNSIVWRKKF